MIDTVVRRASPEQDELAKKTEFGKYADVLAKVKKKLNDAQTTINKAETRTRAIQRKLRDVEGIENTSALEEADPEGDPLHELISITSANED